MTTARGGGRGGLALRAHGLRRHGRSGLVASGHGHGGFAASGHGRRRAAGERGSAIVEFIGVGVLLGVPLFYLVIALAGVHAAALGAASMAQHLAAIQVRSPDAGSAAERLELARVEMARAGGLDPARVHAAVSCDRPCPGPSARVTVTVTVSVALPLLPAVAVARVESRATAITPRFG
ncbi:MAG: hypothetical protein LBE25_01210 [Arthrobacter sp.]|jgi:hypothetical protein|nr:hypothetical protein [Arthrobacter sp.]